MRNLTIKRHKSFVACAVKMKVYIEDHTSNEIMINNIPCRKLGTLKNGAEENFLIDNNEAKIFVIGDKLTKDYCNDFYTIPAGEEDISLSGKNHYNLLNANAFLFDGVNDEEVLQKRKKNKRKGIIIIIACIIAGVIIGLLPNLLSKPEPKVFASKAGITITLTDEFKRNEHSVFTDVYSSSKASVSILQDKFNGTNYSIVEYGRLYLKANNMESLPLEEIDGMTCFEVTENENGVEYTYLGFIFKDTDCFWVTLFKTYQNDYDELRPQFIDWAKSIKY